MHWIFYYKFRFNKDEKVEGYLYEVTFYDRQIIGVILPVCPFPFFDFQVTGQEYNKSLMCWFDYVWKLKVSESDFKTLYWFSKEFFYLLSKNSTRNIDEYVLKFKEIFVSDEITAKNIPMGLVVPLSGRQIDLDFISNFNNFTTKEFNLD